MLNAGFDANEARALLGIATAAGILGPIQGTTGIKQTAPAADAQDPIPHDDGTAYPYSYLGAPQIWPDGWQTPSGDADWSPYIVTSKLKLDNIPKIITGPMGANNAILAYNPTLDAYALAFAGTENLEGAIEDLMIAMVPAGKFSKTVYGKQVTSNANYLASFPDPTRSCSDSGGQAGSPPAEPPTQNAMLDFGFRVGLESLTINQKDTKGKRDLTMVIKDLNKSEIDIFVTGHSLGGPLAALCAAWLNAGGIRGVKCNVKCYTFASPKAGNHAFAANYDAALTNAGLSYRVFNSLDTIPQLPPTLEATSDLNNPVMAKELYDGPANTHAPKAIGELIAKIEAVESQLDFGTLNYNHVGSPIVLRGQFPVVSKCQDWPKSFFPKTGPKKLKAMQREWWQHWPSVYASYLNKQFPS